MASVEIFGAEDGCCSKDGPVLTMMNKRLRALKKKYNRIVQIEESKAQGKPINKEQEDVLKSKVQVLTLIDEYERLKQPLLVAIKEEIAEKEKEWLVAKDEQASEDKEGGVSTQSTEDVSSGNLDETAPPSSVNPDEVAPEEVTESPMEDRGNAENIDGAISDIIQLMYFAQLFDVKSCGQDSTTAWTRYHERTSCLSYDLVTDDSTSPLVDADLEALATFGLLLTTRPQNATLSHKEALQNCIEHAHHWLQASDTPVDELKMTYYGLKERLNRIIATEYFTMTPELQTVSEYRPNSASAVHEILVHEDQYVNGDVANSTGNASDSSGTHAEASQNQVFVNESSVSEEEHITAEKQQPQELNSKPQNHTTNTSQQQGGGNNNSNNRYNRGGRGYGRGRGYRGNGRGNRGGYANGRGNYDQQGNYYQRNYYNGGNNNVRRGGGRGYYNNYNNNNNANYTNANGTTA